MLRATGRIYLGLGPDPGDEAKAPTAEEQEKADRPLPLMLAPVLVLLLVDFAPAAWVEHLAPAAARMFAGAAHLPGAPGTSPALLPYLSTGLAILLAAWALGRDHVPKLLTRTTDAAIRPVYLGLDVLHSGLFGDYVTWMTVGLSIFATASWLG